jgi:hypothetical protein
MGKIFINKNGKTLVHNLEFVERSSYNNTETRLSFLYGDKIVFTEDFQPINHGDYLFANCNVECVKGVLNVQDIANYMFSGHKIEKNISDTSSLETTTRLREVDLKCTVKYTYYMFSDNENLETVKLELPNATNINSCFSTCKKLKNVSLIAPNV